MTEDLGGYIQNAAQTSYSSIPYHGWNVDVFLYASHRKSENSLFEQGLEVWREAPDILWEQPAEEK